MGFGDSGEKEGKLVRDLSEAAIELAELEMVEGRRLVRPRTVVDRLLLRTELPLFVLSWETERSRSCCGGPIGTSTASMVVGGRGFAVVSRRNVLR
jgi:hypothetical protein